ncbi:hypothetical protein, partial [Polycladidibacter stylochi]|uniref:hypothetical protein n=1 Tax=Polycladidibacter stylochi TaxID=1807766 RepID=UPI000A7932DD
MTPFDIWSKGVPLQRSPLYFANKDKKAEFQRLRAENSLKKIMERTKALYDEGKPFHEAMSHAYISNNSSEIYKGFEAVITQAIE